MTETQRQKCYAIIHSHAAACGAGNLVPVPGVGVAADLLTMTTMCMSLAAVFGADINENAAKGLAVAAFKRTVTKQPVKLLAKELSKLIPGLGQIVAPAVSIGMIESTGWTLAQEMERKASAGFLSCI